MIQLTSLSTGEIVSVNPDKILYVDSIGSSAIPIIGEKPPPKTARIVFSETLAIAVKESAEEVISKLL